jgi:hypothetical protein
MPKPLNYPLFTGFNVAERHFEILDTLAQAQRCSRAAAMRRLIEQAGKGLSQSDEENNTGNDDAHGRDPVGV